MKKNSWFNFKNPSFIISCIAVFGALGTGILTAAKYISLPEKVEAVEQKTEKIEDYIKEQRMANDMMQKIIQQDNQLEVVYSPDGKFYFDQKLGKWRSIKELPERGK